MTFVPYLHFGGNCREAFAFYASVFGMPPPEVMTYRQLPEEMRAQMASDTLDRVMHTQLDVAGSMLMGADGAPPENSGSMSVNVMVDDPHEAERVFAALLDGGVVNMPIQPTFWSQRFGMGVDRFGHQWMVNCASAPA